ncbi:hypothetical protein JSO19_08045 [Leucobacter sp. UCMA 4100]|uniref:DUF5979 domain-containing protein n=1 Tax=Leucobacter sp. UCMA 4100 TaxID=2810534 RepID=UPI0022EB4841|nr:DUF5979 domain-containing protein [Leucobacter sp. UCMA 4100]MDA3147331.1 hypothetical protein [Leucobacter sp. UCMA 4100]
MKFGNRIMRRVVATLGILGIVGAAVTTAPGVAVAAGNTEGIVVSDLTIEMEGDGQLMVGDKLYLSGTWDASAITPKAGDSFTIGLPAQLKTLDLKHFPLNGPSEGSSKPVVWGECTVDGAAQLVTCVLTDEVETGSFDVMGTFEFEVEAVQTTEAKELVFDLNGTQTPVVLPGDGGIHEVERPEVSWGKSGMMNDNRWSVDWQIVLPGQDLQGNDTVTIDEKLSANHQLCTPVDVRLVQQRDGRTVAELPGSIEHIEGANDQTFSYRLTAPAGGWDPQSSYLITYSTCTPDGAIDPKGTEYTNEATVSIYGEGSGVIGVTQDWDYTDGIDKWGYVREGKDRNDKIDWTVRVDGNLLADKAPFTFTDSLSGAHELCSNTVSGIRVFEQYGPSGKKRTEITDELVITSQAEDATSFEAEIALKQGSDFAFKKTPYLYFVTYQTCGTTDGLPAEATKLDNTASVAGTVVTGKAKVQERKNEKTGKINDTPVTIDGVELLPQTTINWDITVPGEKLESIDSDLVVTDTLSESQAVCLADDVDLAKRLNLKVTAKDQIKDGGLADVDLTDSVKASLDGNTMTLTVPRPQLPLPDGNVANGFSKEYQYLFHYTTCTASGGLDERGTEYGNAAKVAGNEYTSSVTQTTRGSGTGQGVARGSVSITKSLASTPGAAMVPSDATFTVHAKEINPKGDVANEYNLTLPIDGSAVSGLNPRGKGWKIELSEVNMPSYPGVVFAAPKFVEATGVTVTDEGTKAVVELTPASNISVELVNTAELGQITVEKAVDGGAAGLVNDAQTYEVTAKIDTSALGKDFPAQADRTLELVAGTPVTIADLPIGSVVTFEEAVPADSDLLTWAADPTIDPQSIEVTAQHVTEPAKVSITNNVERTVGTFSLSKTVTGDQAQNPAVPAEVTVTAVWSQDGADHEKTLQLPTDGTAVALDEQLLIGTEVTLTETPLVDGESIAWGAPTWSGTGVAVDGASAKVTVTRDAAAHVALENHAATSTAGLSIVKGIAGEAATEVAPETEFPITATWVDAAGDTQSKELMINAVTPTELGEELPAGTVVTIREGDQPAFDTVIWGEIVISGTDVVDAGDGSATVTVSKQQSDSTLVTVVNEATWAPGTFGVAKTVTGIAPDHADVPETVTVQATWFDDQLDEWISEITLPTDGTNVALGLDLPHGTVVTLTEVMPENTDRLTWAAPVWGGDVTVNAEGNAVVVVQAAGNAEVSLTNTATPLLGSVSITKQLEGSGADAVADTVAFPVTATWVDIMGEEQVRDLEVVNGKTTVIDGVSLGTVVTLVEGETELASDLHWKGGVWSSEQGESELVAGEAAEATVLVTGEAGANADLTLTNTIEQDDPVVTDEKIAMTGSALNVAGIVLAALAAMGAGFWLMRRKAQRSDV